MVEREIKTQIEYPLNVLFILFVVEIIFVIIIIGACGGVAFFRNDVNNLAIFISLGMLTFISVFANFVLTKESNYLSYFNQIIKKYEESLKIELDERYKSKSISQQFLKEYDEHKKGLKEFKFFVNPLLWFYLSIFIFICTILVSISTIESKILIATILVYAGILVTLFLVTALVVIYIAFLLNKNKEEKSALVQYKIASFLPGTVKFNFIKDNKVWFWIKNFDSRKYLAYIKISFFIDNNEEILIIDKDYYSGYKPFNLNAFDEFVFPGLAIPSEVKKAALQKKKIEIRINCEIKDENNKLIEKKLPQGYVYQYGENSWYLEP